MADQNWERKFSYMEAMAGKKEEKQAELLSFKRSSNDSCVEKVNSNSGNVLLYVFKVDVTDK